MQLEGVGAVTMRRILFQVAGEVDDADRLKRTFLTGKHNHTGTESRISSKQQTFVHIPQPIQSVSEILAILSVGTTSIQSFPVIDQSEQ